jgi:hypothetical protein
MRSRVDSPDYGLHAITTSRRVGSIRSLRRSFSFHRTEDGCEQFRTIKIASMAPHGRYIVDGSGTEEITHGAKTLSDAPGRRISSVVPTRQAIAQQLGRRRGAAQGESSEGCAWSSHCDSRHCTMCPMSRLASGPDPGISSTGYNAAVSAQAEQSVVRVY